MISPVMPTYSRTAITFTHGEGAWLWDSAGRRFLDMGAGIAVNALGHAHPALVEALTDQAGKLWHLSNLYTIPAQERLAAMLVDATFADTVFFTNSGTEAAELAIKMARKAKPEGLVLTMEGAFHGRSTGAIAAVGSEKLAGGYGPLMPGFRSLPFDDADAMAEVCASEDVAAIMVEPIQGEGGIRPLSDSTLKRLREIADDAGALLVFDEVQCGMGRTGKLFGHEWAGVTPDIMMSAKGIGGGFPLGAVLATEAAAGPMTPGTHGSTYGGNPLACAVGAKVMEIVNTPEFLAEVNRKAGLLRQGLEGLVATEPEVFTGVRGQGLMLGLMCKPAVGDVVEAAFGQELLAVPAADNTMRLLPPLTLTDDDIAEALQRLTAAAKSL